MLHLASKPRSRSTLLDLIGSSRVFHAENEPVLVQRWLGLTELVEKPLLSPFKLFLPWLLLGLGCALRLSGQGKAYDICKQQSLGPSLALALALSLPLPSGSRPARRSLGAFYTLTLSSRL